jgi:hypothetical protein
MPLIQLVNVLVVVGVILWLIHSYIPMQATDAVQKADSGHASLRLDAEPIAWVLWARFLRHNPANPQWFKRDWFVLSAGHGRMQVYRLLHLSGNELPPSNQTVPPMGQCYPRSSRARFGVWC